MDDSSANSPLKRTVLFENHKNLSAKLVPFAGWEMPVQYSGLIAEHLATRQNAGLFDVSHMGQLRLVGNDVCRALDYLSCNNVSGLIDGQAQYGAVLNPQGGVVDDIIVYRISAKEFFVCVNASNTDKVFHWFSDNNIFDLEVINESAQWNQIAIQGPKARQIAEKYFSEKLLEVGFFRFKIFKFSGAEIIAARTGYTGEDGFEFFVPNNLAEKIWTGLLTSGSSEGLVPCGLGARDTLRLEACLPLHGHELADDITALESGLDRFIDFNKDNFIGKEALLRQKNSGQYRKLSGFVLKEPGIARQSDKILDAESSQQTGIVTSGTKTPTINKSIGLALLYPNKTPGSEVVVEIRGKKITAEVISIPFYRRPKPKI